MVHLVLSDAHRRHTLTYHTLELIINPQYTSDIDIDANYKNDENYLQYSVMIAERI